MLIRIITVLLFTGIASIAVAAEWRSIEGDYAITEADYPDAPEGQVKTHFRLQLSGSTAKELYDALPAGFEKDLCSGAEMRSSGDLRCYYTADQQRYECDFSINLKTSEVDYGTSC